jgi:hypothetical protein
MIFYYTIKDKGNSFQGRSCQGFQFANHQTYPSLARSESEIFEKAEV